MRNQPDGGPKRRYLDNGRTPLQQRIIEASERHPELDKSQIAELVGCQIQHVYRTLKRFALGTLIRPSRELKRREKKSGSYTIRPCLRCGKPHRSEHFGDRLCPSCKPSSSEICCDEYSVYLDHTPVGMR